MLDSLLTFLSKKMKFDAHYFIKGGFWLSLSQGLAITASLIVSAILVNTLDQADYGMYRYLITFGLILSAFSLTGINEAIFQTASKGYLGFLLPALRASALYSFPVVALALCASVYYFYAGNTMLAVGSVIIALLQPLLGIFQGINPYLQGSKRHKEATLLQLARSTCITVALLCAISLTQNVLILFALYLFSNIIVLAWGHFYYRKEIRLAARDENTEEVERHIGYAKHRSLQGIITIIANRLDSLLVFQQLGATHLAIYAVANMLPEQIKGAIKNMGLLVLHKYARQDNLEKANADVGVRTFQLSAILLGGTILYIPLVEVLYPLVFPEYGEAVLLTQIVALSFPAMSAIIPLSYLKARMNEKRLYQLQISTATSTTLLLIIGTLLFGVFGTIIARTLSRYVQLGTALLFALNTHK